MDWGDVSAWVALGLSVIALAVSIWSSYASHRSAKASERSADAAEQQLKLVEQEAARYEIPWRLEHHSGDTYRLTNDGDEPCQDVRVDGEVVTRGADPAPMTLGPREALTFFAARDMGTSDDNVTVTWNRPPEKSAERMTWRHPLPSRPPRPKRS